MPYYISSSLFFKTTHLDLSSHTHTHTQTYTYTFLNLHEFSLVVANKLPYSFLSFKQFGVSFAILLRSVGLYIILLFHPGS